MGNQPSVDVIIPAYKPERSFAELLRRLEMQTYPPEHILVINTDEAYWDPDLARDRRTVEVFHIDKTEFDHGATRNMGAGFSNADILVYMTQDAMPADNDLIARLVQAFRRPAVKAAYARQLASAEASIVEGFTRTFNYPAKSHIQKSSDLPTRGIKTFFCSNVCAAYDHALFRELGGFSEPSIFNEDMIYGGRVIRLGYEIAYAAQAAVIHSHNYTKRQQFHRYFDNGVSQAMHPEIFRGVKSAGEGMSLVRETAKHLRALGKGYLVPGLYVTSGFKFLGFRLGRIYRHLPRGLVRAFSWNREFWDRAGLS